MLFDMFDIAIAQQLGVSTEEYIRIIELADEDVATEIVDLVLFSTEIEKAKKLFYKIEE